MKKRVLSFLLCFMMVMTLFSNRLPAYAKANISQGADTENIAEETKLKGTSSEARRKEADIQPRKETTEGKEADLESNRSSSKDEGSDIEPATPSSGMRNTDAESATPSSGKRMKRTAAADWDLPQAGPLAGSSTTGQPMNGRTGGSENFRIPAIITLQNGWLMAAADARWGTGGDGGGLDTIVSISKDNGDTWEYSFPIYFPDSDGYAGNQATTIIDPALIQGSDETIYLIADVNPTGVTTMGGFKMPGTGTGYINVDGVKRLALTNNYSKVNICPADSDITSYPYYVGDVGENGYSPVIDRETNQPTEYVVDEWFNLFKVGEDDSILILMQKQVNTSQDIKQNVFYKGSDLHVYNTGYMWLLTSTDNGATWSMKDLNPQIKRNTETGLLVSPGRGTLLRDGTIIIPFYNHFDSASGTPNLEHSSFIWSKDDGATWHRTEDVPGTNGFSSECELVELDDGTLRLFVRSSQNAVAYADAVWDGENYVWNTAVVSTGVPARSGCNVSAIMYSQQIDSKDAILVACPGNPNSRSDGRIYVFLVDDDNSMTLGYTFAVNNGYFAYSCLTEHADGKIGLLWEHKGAAITYSIYDITKIALKSAINGERRLTVPLYGTLTERAYGGFDPDPMPDGYILSIDTQESSETMALLGSSHTFSGKSISLRDCLYTFTGDSVKGWTVRSVSNSSIYLNHSVKAGQPNSNTPKTIQVEAGQKEGFSLKTKAANNADTFLYFWKNEQIGKTYSFDRQGNLDQSGKTDFLLYHPANGEKGSAEIPGYVKVTDKDAIVSGERYLVVSHVNDSYFVLHPTFSITDRYAHVARVGGADTVSQITYTGLKDGFVTFTDKVSGYKYTVNITATNLVEVPVKAGDTVTFDLNRTEVTHKADDTIALAEAATTKVTTTYNGCQGNLGANSSYTDASVPMSKALYTFTSKDGGTSYKVSGQTVDGTPVYLSLRDGQAGYPQTSDAGNAGTISLSADGSGGFYISSSTDSYSGYLHFHHQDAKAFRFDQQKSFETLDQLKFQLFRPARESEPDGEIPGYLQVTDAKEIVSGERYLIVHKVNGAYYALYPSASADRYYSHVIKANLGSGIVSDTITDTFHTLTITGVAPGVTDFMVNGVVYRIRVTADQSAEADAAASSNTGNLTVISSGTDDGSVLTFTIILDKPEVSGTFGDMTFTNGIASFTLKPGESKTAAGLPAGTFYSVEEKGNHNYSLAKANTTGTIRDSATVLVAFKSYKGDSGSSGQSGNSETSNGGGSSLTTETPKVPLKATNAISGLIPVRSSFTFFLRNANGQTLQVKTNQGASSTLDTLMFNQTEPFTYYLLQHLGMITASATLPYPIR